MKKYLPLFLILIAGCAAPPIIETCKIDLKYRKDKEAIRDCSEAVRQYPDNPEAHFLLGKAYAYTSKYEEAVISVEKAIELDSTWVNALKKEENKRVFYPCYFNAGVKSMEKKEYEDAIRRLHRATEIDPTRPGAYVNLGFIYAELKKEEEMVNYLGKAIEVDPKNFRAYHSLGSYYYRKGEYEKATEYIDSAINYGKENVAIFQEQFSSMSPTVNEDNTKKVLSMLEDTTVVDKFLTEELGIKNASQARFVLNKLMQNMNEIVDGYVLEALIFLNTDKEKEAEEILQEALKVDESDLDVLFYFGLSLLRQKRYEESVSPFKKMTEVDSLDERGWFQLGAAYFRTKDYDGAISCFTKVIEINPQSVDGYTNRGHAYAGKADLAKKKGRKKEERELRDKAYADFKKAGEIK